MILLGNGQIYGSLVQLKLSGFFRDLILMDASEMNNNVGFILGSAYDRFCSSMRVSTFKFDAIYSIDFSSKILINGFFEFLTFVLGLLRIQDQIL